MRLNRRCIACSTLYSYCPNCSGADRFAPSWKAEFCSEPCKDLWLTATRFNMNILSKDEAKSIILNLDLKPIDHYVACVQRDYDKIMVEEKKYKRGKRIEINLIDETIVEPAVIELTTEQQEEVAESHEIVLKEEE